MTIKKQILRGSVYTGGAKYFNMLITLLTTSILARILAPSDFGIIALTTVVMSFFDILATAGLGPAIIQSKTLNKDEYKDIFTWSVLIALVCFLLFNCVIRDISDYYKEEKLIRILRLLSFQLLFTSLNVFPYSLMLKSKMFKELSIISSSNTLLFGVVSIVMAYSNFGIYSLLALPIGNSIMSFVICSLFMRKYIGITLIPRFRPFGELLHFSMYQFSFNLINFFSRNLDKLLLGKYIGMESLGYYEKSYRLMTLPISTLTNVFAPTIQPILATYQDEKQVIRDTYNSLSKYLLALGAIITPFFFFSAREIIMIVFGSQWEKAVPVFQVLAISIMFQLVDSLSGSILQSSNNVKYLFVSGTMCSAINISFLIAGLVIWGDIIIVSICVALSYILNFFISTLYINKYAVCQSLVGYYAFLKIPMLMIFVISIALFLVSFIDVHVHIVVSIIIKFIVTIAISYYSIKLSGYIVLPSLFPHKVNR